MKSIYVLLAAMFLSEGALRAFEPGTVVAFSLREASDMVNAGANSLVLKNLAGITRFAGFVYDNEDPQDIILVGKVIPQKPAITLDDLVTGLRAWLVYHEFPLVSIDPTNDTEQTRQQVVRLEGHLAGTQWGFDFVRADVALKQLCLKMLSDGGQLRSYRDYFEDEIRERARTSGTQILDISWESGGRAKDIITKHIGQGVRITNSSQCRFWFYPTERQQPVYRNGVFCIKELRLGVQPEESDATNGSRARSPGALFAQAFSDSFEAISVHEPLSRLKGLYDLFSIAKAIETANIQSIVTNLLVTYRVTAVQTRARYPLEELIGVVRRTDGLQQLVRLSGGITFDAEIELLQGGSIPPLRTIVTKTRPTPHALAWALPLGAWNMPNMDADAVVPRLQPPRQALQFPGCRIAADSVVFQPLGQPLEKGSVIFTDFNPVGGVRLANIITQGDFERVNLQPLKKSLLGSRTNADALSGEVK